MLVENEHLVFRRSDDSVVILSVLLILYRQ
jgi:hypothetical protein